MISVIIPVFNASRYLPACIESVLAQTYKDFELILINDGSTDDSKEICEFYAQKDKRIRFINKENSGVGHTRNLGIEKAKGERICFIDSDDEVTSDYLESFNLEDTSADVVYTGIDIVDVSDNHSIRQVKFEQSILDKIQPSEIKRFLPLGYPVGKAYRKSIIQENNLKFPTSISLHEDHVFVLEYLNLVTSIETSDKVTYLYKIDLSNNSLSKKKHPSENLVKASEYLFNSLSKLRDKYNLSIEDTAEFNSFCYEPRITALINLYSENLRPKERRRIIKSVLSGQYNINELYLNGGSKGKLVKMIYNGMPLFFADGLFYLLAKLIDFKHNV